MPDRVFFGLLIASLCGVFVWSAAWPHDYFTWLLEVLPVAVGFPLLVATRGRFRFTRLAYALMWGHAIILIVGGHYTYALVPLGEWVREAFDLGRNHYDRLGHFAQGFIPAIVAREIMVRLSPVKRGAWLFFFVITVCISISAVYELMEWSVAELSGTRAEAFLGMQGDVWDTQKDLALATLGAVSALFALRRVHDRQLRAMEAERGGV